MSDFVTQRRQRDEICLKNRQYFSLTCENVAPKQVQKIIFGFQKEKKSYLTFVVQDHLSPIV